MKFPVPSRAASLGAVLLVFARQVHAAKVVYIDGSGGPKYAPASAPHMGSALAVFVVDEDGTTLRISEVGVEASTVPGRQTVPRAELWAANMAAEYVHPGERVELRPDASYVSKGMAAIGPGHILLRGRNGTLWSRLMETGSGHLTAVKVTSHQDTGVLLRG